MLISHHISNPQLLLGEIKTRLSNSENLCCSLQETLRLAEELASFDLGQFLLANHGLNGYWTAYVILYGKNKKALSPLENWLLDKAPIILATRERFYIFQKEILKRLKPSMQVASLPCGLMEDFLSLSPDDFKDVHSTGIDLDEGSLKQAQEIALERKRPHCYFIKRDAWHLNLYETFDLVASNGLNIYEPDSKRIIAFYREIAKALRPNGILITSYLPDTNDKAKPRPQKEINPADALKQQAIFHDIIQANWQYYQTEASIRIQLQEAGLTVEEIIYDSQCLFPTVIAKKIKRA